LWSLLLHRVHHGSAAVFQSTVSVGQLNAVMSLLALFEEQDDPQPPGERRCFASSQSTGGSNSRQALVHLRTEASSHNSALTRFWASAPGHAVLLLISGISTQLNAPRIWPMLSAEHDLPQPFDDSSYISSSQLEGSLRHVRTHRTMSLFCISASIVLDFGVCIGFGVFFGACVVGVVWLGFDASCSSHLNVAMTRLMLSTEQDALHSAFDM
jgi:hypothetical protein